MTVVRFTPATVRALDRALLTMEAERAAAEKWQIADLGLEEAIEELTNHRDCMLAEQAEIAGAVVRMTSEERGEHTLRVIRGIAQDIADQHTRRAS